MFSGLKDNLTSRKLDLEKISKATGVNAEKVALAAITQLQTKPELWPYVAANQGSFISAVLTAAEQGLDFSKPNEAHLVGYGGKEPKVVLQRGYKGWMKLARRSPGTDDVEAHAIYSNDIYNRGIGPNSSVSIEMLPFGQDRGKLIGFVAIAYMTNGRVKFDEMTAAEVLEHCRRFSKAQSYGPFANLAKVGESHENFIPYGLKTVVIRLCNRQLDLSSEVALAMEEFEEVSPVKAVVKSAIGDVLPQGPINAPILSIGEMAGTAIIGADPDMLSDYLSANAEAIPADEAKAILSEIA